MPELRRQHLDIPSPRQFVPATAYYSAIGIAKQHRNTWRGGGAPEAATTEERGSGTTIRLR
jgi:hypothetical protein